MIRPILKWMGGKSRVLPPVETNPRPTINDMFQSGMRGSWKRVKGNRADRVLKEEPSLILRCKQVLRTLTLKRDPELIDQVYIETAADNNPANHLYGNKRGIGRRLMGALFDFAQRHSRLVAPGVVELSGLTVAPTHRANVETAIWRDGRDIVGIAQMRGHYTHIGPLAETVIARIQHKDVILNLVSGAICEELEYDVTASEIKIISGDAYAELSKDDGFVLSDIVWACHSKLFDKVIFEYMSCPAPTGDVEQKLVEKEFVPGAFDKVGLALVLDHTGGYLVATYRHGDPTLTCHYFEEFLKDETYSVYVVRNKETWERSAEFQNNVGTDTVRARRLKALPFEGITMKTVAKLFRSSIKGSSDPLIFCLFTRYPHVVTQCQTF
ncbi:hypothetical protein SPFM15_00178 [Salmonella phage SPFM15]|nr:hypothetical protein SPFM5_00173 [Salmonella phage SPFM5]VFR13802.1 hypothetical protein SPFM15_00178 [Salmonella phage SPFM15]